MTHSPKRVSRDALGASCCWGRSMTGVIGLDLSIASTGVARVDGSTCLVKVPTKLRGGERLGNLREGLIVAVELHTIGYPDIAIVEGPSLGSPGIAGKLSNAEWRGVVLCWLHQSGIPVAIVPPLSLKQWATGNGLAKKEAMMAAATERGWENPSVKGADDLADAFLLRACGLAVIAGEDHPALAKVDWPSL